MQLVPADPAISRHHEDNEYMTFQLTRDQPILQAISEASQIHPWLKQNGVLFLQSGKTVYACRKYVLKRHSKLFSELFPKHLQSSHIEIHSSDKNGFKPFIECLHHNDKLQFLSSDNALKVLAVASKYKAKEVKSACDEFLSTQPVDVKAILQVAKETSSAERFFESLDLASYTDEQLGEIESFAKKENLPTISDFCQYLLFLRNKTSLKDCLSLRKGTISIVLDANSLATQKESCIKILQFQPKNVKAKVIVKFLALPAIAILKEILTNNKTITGLDLSHNNISSEEAEELAKILESLEQLDYLNLRYTNLKDEGIKQLHPALQKLVHMRSLNLSRNQISDEGIKEFNPKFQELTHLNLSSNGITDASTEHLALILQSSSTTLSKINLATNFITSKGIRLLVKPFCALKKLPKIDLRMNDARELENLSLANIIEKISKLHI